MRVLVAGIGHDHLRDLTAPVALVRDLRRFAWLAAADVRDLSFSAIEVVQQLRAEKPYERIVLIASVLRQHEPGQLTCYRWNKHLPDEDDIQRRVAEVIMGIVHLDHLLILGEHFGVLPDEVFVIEIEPEDTTIGEGVSPCVAAAMNQAIETVRRILVDGRIDELPCQAIPFLN